MPAKNTALARGKGPMSTASTVDESVLELEVCLQDQSVGSLLYSSANNEYSFRYSPSWFEMPTAHGLSPSLQPEDSAALSNSALVKNLFENLLPEGRALEEICANRQISKANVAGLLANLGLDLAGAVSIKVKGSKDAILDEPGDRLRPVSQQELSERIRNRSHSSLTYWDGKVRLSVAGYQDKVVVFEREGDWYFSNSPEISSTVIIKPEPVNPMMAGAVYNEFVCMRLADMVGVPAATVRLERIPEPILIVDRFDREVSADNESVRRIHVVDGCQALGLPVTSKYERLYGNNKDVSHIRDGASLPLLFGLRRHSTAPIVDDLKLLRWTIFQVLICNTDAHAKNISYFYDEGGLRLAPTYDLLCAPAFNNEGLVDDFAMGIGDAFTTQDLNVYEWADFCFRCQLTPQLVAKEIKSMTKKLHEKSSEMLRIARDHDVPASLTDFILQYAIEVGEAQSKGVSSLTSVYRDEYKRKS